MGKLVEIKTKATNASIDDFINKISGDEKRNDCLLLLELFKTLSKEEPKLWGNSIIGFGTKIYESPATGRQVEWFKIGFSPRKANLSLHLMLNLEKHATLIEELGKHKTGAGCIYITSLKSINQQVLKKIIQLAVKNK